MALTHGIRRHKLTPVPFATGGGLPVSLETLPPGHRVHGFEMHLPATITQGGAAALYTGDKLARLIAKAKVGKRAEGSGRFWDILNWLMYGRHTSLVADAIGTNAAALRRDLRWFINYADPKAAHPEDHMPRTEVLSDQPLEITFGDVASLFPSLASVAGNLQPYAIIEPAPRRKMGSPVVMGHKEVAGLQTTLQAKGVAYTHLFLFKEDLTAFTAAEVATVTVRADGETLYSDMSPASLVTMFNRNVAEGTALEATHATAPVPGERLNDQPDPAGGGTAYSFPFLPLYVPDARNQATRALRVRQGLEITVTGTLTACRVGYRALEMQSTSQAVRAAQKAGIPASGYRPATADGVGTDDAEGGSLVAKHV